MPDQTASKSASSPSLRNSRLLYSMIRVKDLDRSLAFYVDTLGMTLFRKETYPAARFTLAFIGYGDEKTAAVIELTYNWDEQEYEMGNSFGHIAISVSDAAKACEDLALNGVSIVRAPGPMKIGSPERDHFETIAFITDPDGYRIELVESD